MEYQTFTLPNGISFVHHRTETEIAYCGVLIQSGSRNETEQQHGLAHFIEHTVFKGTQKRKSFHVLNRLETLGGELNAYTTKEETCIYASILAQYIDRAIELIADILINATFPERELEKEKEIIIDEINSYKDSPAEQIFDTFEEMIFQNQSLGRNILGSEQTIKSFTRADVINFIQQNYSADKIIFCSISKHDFTKIKNLCEKHFAKATFNTSQTTYQPAIYTADNRKIKYNTHQAHCIIGGLAYGIKDKRRISLRLLNNLLGGNGLNSRLNLALREKHGIAYTIESNYSTYSDLGIFSIYFGTDPQNVDKGFALIDKELKKLCEQKLGTLQLRNAKRQMLGQIAMSAENKENLMFTFARSFLFFRRIDSFEEIQNKIEAITSEQIMEIANDIFDTKKTSSLIFI